jgi:histidine triad (HIT) family protein
LNCEFCAIVRGEAEATIIAADSDCIAFFPEEPATLGHTLIVPKEHVRDIWSMGSDDLIAPLMNMAIRVGRALDVVVEPEGMNLITSAGAAASQTVFHLHLHVVPRWSDDRMGPIWPEDGLELEEQASKLAHALQREYDDQE